MIFILQFYVITEIIKWPVLFCKYWLIMMILVRFPNPLPGSIYMIYIYIYIIRVDIHAEGPHCNGRTTLCWIKLPASLQMGRWQINKETDKRGDK